MRVATLEAEITASTSDFERGMSAVEKTIAGTRTTIGSLDKDISAFGHNLGSTNDALSAMGISIPTTPMAAMGQAVGFVGGQLKDAVEKTIAWADSMDKLARNTGGTIEETSKMAIVMGDFGIQAGTMEMALKSLNAKGLTLNIETLGTLAAEYQALPPGVDRLRFATDHFGRSAQEMTEILSQTPAKLAAMGEAAAKSGKIMSEEAVEAAQEFKIELQQLNDTVDGLKISAGPGLISALEKVVDIADAGATAFFQLDKMLRLNAVDNLLLAGGIDEVTAALRKQMILNGGLTNAVKNLGDAEDKLRDPVYYAEKGISSMGAVVDEAGKGMEAAARQAGGYRGALVDLEAAHGRLSEMLAGPVGKANDDYYADQKANGAAIMETKGAIEELTALPQLSDKQRAELAELQGKLKEQQGAYAETAAAHEDATARILFGYLEQNLAIDGLTAEEVAFLGKVGKAWGVLDAATGDAMTNMSSAILTAKGDADAFLGVMDGIYGLPHEQTFRINVETNYTSIGDESFGGWTAPVGSGVTDTPAPVIEPVGPGGMQLQSRPPVINNFNFNNAAPVTIPTAMQTARAMSAAW